MKDECTSHTLKVKVTQNLKVMQNPPLSPNSKKSIGGTYTFFITTPSLPDIAKKKSQKTIIFLTKKI